ncbi:hypothetical protein TNCT_328261 [Trichonephila clavata]|uniref:Uncharacterized protein n=1 Tax=Trichonephila clavata TaxID=2740835 RepID=A0A8X6M2G4_TRICU|nr:hypothetical protein TNCT_328261 [Trichonephila clavata]
MELDLLAVQEPMFQRWGEKLLEFHISRMIEGKSHGCQRVVVLRKVSRPFSPEKNYKHDLLGLRLCARREKTLLTQNKNFQSL